MKIEIVEPKIVFGLKTRTKNADEMNPSTAKIGGLWQNFFSQRGPLLKSNSKVYGVYTNYESDMNGSFDVYAGADSLEKSNLPNLETVSIQKGKYLVFSSKGGMPQAVITAWTEIWNYFSSPSCPHQRAYTTDFEFYKSDREVEVFIAIK
ncbi:GyrI-like domain-containing protein [bacterium]|nr:GyrI-like domain-containing protein [bacterium]